MATILATGPAPVGRSARLGQAAGEGMGAALLKGFQDEEAARQVEADTAPMRDAILSALGGMTEMTPGQTILNSVVQDPRMFARAMANPSIMGNVATLGALVEPPKAAPQTEMQEMLAAYEAANVAEAAGDTGKAELLRGRAMELAGLDKTKPEEVRVSDAINDALNLSRAAAAAGDADRADLYMNRARDLAGMKATDEAAFPEMAEMMELVDQSNYYRGVGDNQRADIMMQRAQKLAGTSNDGLPAIIQTVTAMGLDPAVGRGRELVEASILGAQRTDQRTQRIDNLIDQGMDPQKAANLVDGFYRIDTNPTTGTVQLIDEINNTVEEIPVSMAGAVRSEAAAGPAIPAQPLDGKEGQTLWDLAPFATGVEASANQALSYPLAMAGLPFPEKTVFARQVFNNEVQSFIRAMAMNDRFPTSEQERLRKEVSVLPSIGNSPERMRVQMQALNSSLQSSMRQYTNNSRNPDLPAQDRAAWSRAAQDINYFLQVLGVPADEAVPGQEGAGALPEGIPAGSRQVGQLDGKAVYQAPDGKQYVVE